MTVLLRMVLIVAAFAALALLARRKPRDPTGIFRVFGDLWNGLARTFTGPAVLFWVAAVGETIAMVAFGWDRVAQDFFQATEIVTRPLARFMLEAGELWTLIVALCLLGLAWSRQSVGLRRAGVASLQAVLTTFVVTVALKAMAGRRGPQRPPWEGGSSFRRTHDPSDFLFEFWNQSVMHGRFFWPSGHTASAFTLVAALVAACPEQRWLAWVGYPVAAFMGLSMIEGDFHWLSDVIAGALIGHVIGWTVGKRVRERFAEPRQALVGTVG